MTKQEALKAAREGKKITHKYFDPKEWFYIGKDGTIVMEDGVECDPEDFFKWRKAGYWDDGYELWQSPASPEANPLPEHCPNCGGKNCSCT
jgi:hypothetical protein